MVLATWARTPLLHAEDLEPGQHLISLGSDEPGKQELVPVAHPTRLIVDDAALVAAHGVLAGAGLPASTPGPGDHRLHPRRTALAGPGRGLTAYQQAEADKTGTTLDLLS
ncbi:hypothetical protein [Streptomyces sp. NPDC101149]|uniref:hypothetical protein n=1 Tax=Streptomyces sp. NPDC101149 TaxID=3366113 RepID=UPI0037FFDF4D